MERLIWLLTLLSSTFTDRPLTGTATWYATGGPGLYAAAGPQLRERLGPHYKDYSVTVCAADECITIPIDDYCQCYAGTADERLIDLSAEAFATLAPLSRGKIQVSVSEDPWRPSPNNASRSLAS